MPQSTLFCLVCHGIIGSLSTVRMKSTRSTLGRRFANKPINIKKSFSDCQNNIFLGAQWHSGRVLGSRPKGRGFKPHQRHWVVSLSKNMVHPRKTRPFMTERLLMGHKKQIKQTKQHILIAKLMIVEHI